MKEMQYIAIEQMHPHPDNPRKDLGDLTELTASIKQSGIYQNLTVVPREAGGYTVVIGHRRRAAAKLAGLTKLPCIVTDMSYKEQLSTMLLENMQRSDLTIYEQAQGFQMMLDLGDTVSTIAQSTGLSETTVRRRVKLLELDREKFEKATARGATLFDFAELNKVKSIESRNELLDCIGTANFNNKLKSIIDKEKTAERMEEIRAILDVFAFRIERSGEFGGVAVDMKYVNWYSSSKDLKVPEDSENVRYFYTEGWGGFALYREHVATEEDTTEEREKAENRRISKIHKEMLDDVSDRHYSLRCDFVKDYTPGKTGSELIIAAAADMLARGSTSRYYNLQKKVCNLLGVECEADDEFAPEYVRNIIERNPVKALLAALSGHMDGTDKGYWRNVWNPEHQLWEIEPAQNDRLDEWYKLLCALGYEMSDEEREMQIGTSPMLQRKWVEECEECQN